MTNVCLCEFETKADSVNIKKSVFFSIITQILWKTSQIRDETKKRKKYIFEKGHEKDAIDQYGKCKLLVLYCSVQQIHYIKYTVRVCLTK